MRARLLATVSLAAALVGAPGLAVAKPRPISGAAFHAADAAYKAYAERRFHEAAQKAAVSVRLRPDIPRLRLLLVRSLRADGRSAEALAAASAATRAHASGPEIAREVEEIRVAQRTPVRRLSPAPIPAAPSAPSGYAEAQRGFRLFAEHQPGRAAEEAAAAVRLAPADIAYRALLIDSLTAAGRLNEAETASASALREAGDDPGLQSRRGFLLLRLGRPADAAPAFEAALARESDPAARRRTALALADARTGAGQPDAALKALAPYERETAYDVSSRRAQALIALKRRPEALEAVRAARAAAPGEDERRTLTLAELYLLTDLGRREEARSLLRRAAADPRFGAGQELEVGEVAIRDGDDEDALVFFKRARAAGRLKGAPEVDAAYAARRRVQNKLSAELFDAALEQDLAAPAFSRDYRYRLGREEADVSRTWGVNASILSGAVTFPSAGAGGVPIGDQRVTQAGGEVYWRPPVIGYRDGRTVELFARLFTTLEDQSGGPTGGASTQGYVGGRWKPFGGENVVLEASRLVRLGSASRDDWLLRAAYSRQGGVDLGDPRPSRPMWQVYGELDRLTDAAETLAFAEGRAGWLFRLDRVSDRLTLSPIVDGAYSFDDRAATESAFGVGPGVAIRYWLKGGRWDANGSYLELTAGQRFRVFGARRANGPFATLSLVY